MRPVKILAKVNTDWRGFGIDLQTVLDNYRKLEAGLPLLTDHLDNCDEGVFLLDHSGLAPHLLGLNLIRRWQNQEILQRYKVVTWLPVKQLLNLPVQPIGEESLDELVKLSDPVAEFDASNRQNNLVVITGIDDLSKRDLADQNHLNCLAKWMDLLTGVPLIAIGNHTPASFAHFESVAIALPPAFINLLYNQVDNDQTVSCCLPGRLLVDEITGHTRSLFRFNADRPSGVFSVPQSTVKNYLSGIIDVVPECKEEVTHAQPLLTLQHVIQVLAGYESLAAGTDKVSILNSPAKWYYAALSADKFFESEPNKKYFLYQIAGNLIVRQTGNHYITNLGSIDNYSPRVEVIGGAYADTDIQHLLQLVVKQENFSELNEETVGRALDLAKQEWGKEKTQARDQAQIEQGQSPSRKPVNLSKTAFHVFKKLKKLLSGDMTDQEIKAGIKQLPPEQRGPSYQVIQKEIGIEESHAFNHSMNKKFRSVISNEGVDGNDSALALCLAANMLSESARYPETFFSLFAIYFLTLSRQTSWNQLVALPERVRIDISQASWDQLILADCLDVLGGLHPMAHNGSFNQIKKEIPHGISWPELKTQLLYITWLRTTLLTIRLGIQLRSAEISFEPKPGYYVLTPNDQRRIMRDFELQLLVQMAYQYYNSVDILHITDRPYQDAVHLVAHPKQLKIIPCGAAAEFGYFLSVKKSVEQQEALHTIHLTMRQMFWIAKKFDATGDDNGAVQLYNYLCKMHPNSIGFHYTRALSLVFREDLMRRIDLQKCLANDLLFLRAHKASLAELSSHDQLAYIELLNQSRRNTNGKPSQVKLFDEKFRANVLAVIEEGSLLMDGYSQWDEEKPVICLAVASAYYQLFLLHRGRELGLLQYLYLFCLNKEEVFRLRIGDLSRHAGAKKEEIIAAANQFSTKVKNKDIWVIRDKVESLFERQIRYCFEAQEGFFFYFVRAAMTVHQSGPIAKGLNRNFKLITKDNVNPLWLHYCSHQKMDLHFRDIDLSTEYFYSLLKKILLYWVSAFKPYIQGDANFKKLHRSLDFRGSPSPGVMRLMTDTERTISALNTKDIKMQFAIGIGPPALLVKMSLHLPNMIIFSWCKYHDMQVEITKHRKLGSCLKITPNGKYQSRSAYQPLLHPNSFKFRDFETTNPSEQDIYFKTFVYLLRRESVKLKQVNLGQLSGRKLSYDLYARKPLLPRAYLIRKDQVHDILIEIRNNTSSPLILQWLKEMGFAWYWVNDTVRGRCVYLPQVNICNDSEYYNMAISNGDILHPYLTRAEAVTSDAGAKFGNPSHSHSIFSKSAGLAAADQSKRKVERCLKKWSKEQMSSKYQQAVQASLQKYRESPGYLRFQQKVQSYDLNLHDVARDGNCFFHAIYHQLTLRGPDLLLDLEERLGLAAADVDHAVLRRLAVGGAIGLASCNDELISAYQGRLQHYLNEGAADGTWAKDLLIEALCHVLQVTVVLIGDDGAQLPVYSYGDRAILYLGYEVQQHFQSTVGEPSEALQLRVALAISEATPVSADQLIDLTDAYQMGSDVEVSDSGNRFKASLAAGFARGFRK